MTLNFHNWPWDKIMTHSQVTCNLYVKLKLLIFLHKKNIKRTKNINVYFNWHLTFTMTLDLNHATPSDHNQSLCAVRTFNISPYERRRPDRYFAIFLPVTLSMPLIPWDKIMTHPQVISNICKEETSNVFQ